MNGTMLNEFLGSSVPHSPVQTKAMPYPRSVAQPEDLSSQLHAQSVAPAGQRLNADYTIRNLHQQLTALTGQADLKASIVITASSITLSLVATRLTDDRVRPAAIVLVVLILAALLCAIYAVLPKYPFSDPTATQDMNPLFFGHAGRLDRGAYQRTMVTLLSDQDALYTAVLADLHTQSKYLLLHKFRPLRWAYVLLLGGFVCAALTLLGTELFG